MNNGRKGKYQRINGGKGVVFVLFWLGYTLKIFNIGRGSVNLEYDTKHWSWRINSLRILKSLKTHKVRESINLGLNDILSFIALSDKCHSYINHLRTDSFVSYDSTNQLNFISEQRQKKEFRVNFVFRKNSSRIERHQLLSKTTSFLIKVIYGMCIFLYKRFLYISKTTLKIEVKNWNWKLK